MPTNEPAVPAALPIARSVLLALTNVAEPKPHSGWRPRLARRWTIPTDPPAV